jgi:ATP-dependent exoDNAse (exonuclease V) beta subunit
MHANIERIFNNLEPSKTIPELEQFVHFNEDVIKARGIQPFRTEWRIAAPELSLGGSVDFVGKLSDGKYVLMDWKRSKNLPVSMYKSYGKGSLR